MNENNYTINKPAIPPRTTDHLIVKYETRKLTHSSDE